MVAAYHESRLPDPLPEGDPAETFDQRVIFHGVTWKDFKALLAIRGDDPKPRFYYLEGELELMSPSVSHEMVKKTFARLLEAYADELGIDIIGAGSWTLKNRPRKRGAEPDECYMIGAEVKKRPDLAIEVIWTQGGLDKLAIYRGLRVGEVWFWDRKEGIQVHLLCDGDYVKAEKSALFPDLNLALIGELLHEPNQSQAVRKLRASLRTQ